MLAKFSLWFPVFYIGRYFSKVILTRKFDKLFELRQNRWFSVDIKTCWFFEHPAFDANFSFCCTLIKIKFIFFPNFVANFCFFFAGKIYIDKSIINYHHKKGRLLYSNHILSVNQRCLAMANNSICVMYIFTFALYLYLNLLLPVRCRCNRSGLGWWGELDTESDIHLSGEYKYKTVRMVTY